MQESVRSNTARAAGQSDGVVIFVRENELTITLRCLNCGFSFTVTYPTADLAKDNARPVTCGHCRSSQWVAQST
jgi:hypothetical protein